jgi:excisionase family DNA binding protein
MPQAVPIEDDELNRAERRAKASDERRPRLRGLRPRFVSIEEAANYLGISRATFYKDHLCKVKTVRCGRRNLVDLESLDELADSLLAAE